MWGLVIGLGHSANWICSLPHDTSLIHHLELWEVWSMIRSAITCIYLTEIMWLIKLTGTLASAVQLPFIYKITPWHLQLMKNMQSMYECKYVLYLHSHLDRWYKAGKQCHAYKMHTCKFIEEHSWPRVKNVYSFEGWLKYFVFPPKCVWFMWHLGKVLIWLQHICNSGKSPDLLLSLQVRHPSQEIRCSMVM